MSPGAHSVRVRVRVSVHVCACVCLYASRAVCACFGVTLPSPLGSVVNYCLALTSPLRGNAI